MNLGAHFEKVEDFRKRGRCLHSLTDILVIVLCGTLSDCSDFAEIEDYAKDKEFFLRNTLGLTLLNGIPSEATLNRVIRYLKSSSLEKSLQSCVSEIRSNVSGKHFSIDGKALRGTIPKGEKQALVQIVSLWLEEEKLSFGQVKVSEKSNEITAIPRLLDAVSIAGSTISIDAMGCQKAIVTKILSKDADYVIALKGNQKQLYTEVKEWFLKHKTAFSSSITYDLGHGRGEKQQVYLCQNLKMLSSVLSWQELNTIVMVETTRISGKKEEVSQRFYISSLKSKHPSTYAKLIRGHWGIENGLHWQLDVTFKEDGNQVREGNGAFNLNIIRKHSLFLLSKESSKMSIKRKRKKAARDNGFLMTILEVV
jgi:predicted transposase YbfD/YdcC